MPLCYFRKGYTQKLRRSEGKEGGEERKEEWIIGVTLDLGHCHAQPHEEVFIKTIPTITRKATIGPRRKLYILPQCIDLLHMRACVLHIPSTSSL